MKAFAQIREYPGVRLVAGGGALDDGMAFQFDKLRVILSIVGGWDHVSVSRSSRTPTWAEMDEIKRICFAPDETVMQLHPATSDHINIHQFTLHLWRPQTVEIPMPPKWMV